MRAGFERSTPSRARGLRRVCGIVPASLALGILLAGCGHGAGDGAGNLPAEAAPNVKAATQFFQDAAAGKLDAAKAAIAPNGQQGDPLGQITTRVKAHGAITDITYDSFNPREGQSELYGNMTFADKTGLHFEVIERSSDVIDPEMRKPKRTPPKWYIFCVFDLATGRDSNN